MRLAGNGTLPLTFLSSALSINQNNSAASSTDNGYLIMWENQSSALLLDRRPEKALLTASKVVRLLESGISLMTTINNFLVVACQDGSIRFYDFNLRLEAWFEDLAAGPVTSLSFSLQDVPTDLPAAQFWVPDFTVGTREALVVGVESAIFQEIRPDDRRGMLLLQGMVNDVMSTSCHPNKSLLGLVCIGGSIQIWDYDLKLLINLRELNTNDSKESKAKLVPQIITFDPTGRYKTWHRAQYIACFISP